MANNKNILDNIDIRGIEVSKEGIRFLNHNVGFPISLKYIKKEAWPEIIRKCEAIRHKFLEILEKIAEPYESHGVAIFLDYKIKLPIEVIEKIQDEEICEVVEIMKTHIFHENGIGKPSDLLFLEVKLMKIEQNILKTLKFVNNPVIRNLLAGFVEELAEIQKELIDLRLFVFENLK